MRLGLGLNLSPGMPTTQAGPPPSFLDIAPSDLKAFWGADQGIAGGAVGSGAGISSWTDQKSGLILTGVSNPTTDLNLGGKASVGFDGIAANFSSLVTLGQVYSAAAYTLFFVVKDNGSPATMNEYDEDASIIGDCSSINGGYAAVSTSATKIYAGQYDGGIRDEPVGGFAIIGGTIYRVCVRYDGVKIRIAVNGSAFDTGVAAGHIQSLGQALRVGKSAVVNPAAYAKCDLGLIAAYDVSLSDSDVVLGQNYMAAAYP